MAIDTYFRRIKSVIIMNDSDAIDIFVKMGLDELRSEETYVNAHVRNREMKEFILTTSSGVLFHRGEWMWKCNSPPATHTADEVHHLINIAKRMLQL